METTKNKKFSYLSILGVVGLGIMSVFSPSGNYQPELENQFIKDVKHKLSKYNDKLSEDRVYIHLDKPMYEPGDDIWFSAYVRDGISLKKSEKSDIVYIELISPKGSVEKKISLIAKNGVAAGDFHIEKEALGGIYKIKAYTNWMKNSETLTSFEKDIQVQDYILPNLKMKLDFEKKAFGAGDEVIAKIILETNENKALKNHPLKFAVNIDGNKFMEKAETTDEEGIHYVRFNLPENLKSNDGLLNVMIDYNGNTESISRSIPIVLNKINFTMFPEGGDIIQTMENTVAFKALNEFNKPADIEGELINDKGIVVTTFSSFHQGMGAFKFTPKKNETYSVRITKPKGVESTYELPETMEHGYALHLDPSQPEELGIDISTTEIEKVSLIAQIRGEVYYTTALTTNPGKNPIKISTKDFPAGVMQVTIFDNDGIARAERLAFINRDKQLNISVKTNKEKYLPREKVTMNITVRDDRGLSMPANLSMAVVNDQFLSFADDKTGNIVSQLLLEQDLNQKVEEPKFYFDKKEAKSQKALDYLMMTAGWRKFTWERIIDKDLPVVKFNNEKAIVNGVVMNSENGQPMPNVTITAPDGKTYTTGTDGKYSISGIDLSEAVYLSYSHNGYQAQSQYIYGYNQNQTIYLYKSYNYGNYNKRSKSGGWGKSAQMEQVPSAAPAMAGASMVVEKAPRLKAKKEGGPVLANNNEKNMDKDAKRDEAKKLALAEVAQEVVIDRIADDREAAFGDIIAMEDEKQNFQQPNNNHYYRARVYYSPTYNPNENVENRTDFRNTIYWNPNIEIGYSGKKTIEFYTSDDITSFKVITEGVGRNGLIGHSEKTFYSQLPFNMKTKIPVEVATEDKISIPVTLSNNTDKPLGGLIKIDTPEGLIPIDSVSSVQTIMPGKSKTIFLDYRVSAKTGTGDLTIGFKACGLGDAFTQTIKIVPKGFPVHMSFSSQEMNKEYEFNVHDVVNGSLKINFSAYPDVVNDLMKGVEGILQEPYGCFEQTSCTAYPNAMVLDYMKTTDSKDTKTLLRATDLLKRGYKRLTTFESSNKGYEWFGANPAHEGLTAYGIMEFVDMKKAGQDIDEKMLERTANWLLSQKDGKGGFKRETHAYHDFGRISEDILNAYIVYALAEAGYKKIDKEFETSYNKAMDTKDAYMLAMMANAAYSLGDTKKGDAALNSLIKKQFSDGSFNGSTHSITYSQGQSLKIETTALSIMAMLKPENKNIEVINKSVKYLVESRSGSGVFSSTQGTILSLKALTEYAKQNKKVADNGTIEIYVDNKKVATKTYKAGDKGMISIDSLESFITKEGNHKIKIKYSDTKNALPYSVAINYNTKLPNSDKDCQIGLETKIASDVIKVGETVRLTSIISNKSSKEVPSTMAIIGIPAGLSVQPWQLKELQEKHVFDYYEIKGNNIAIYYRGMAANDQKTINLDLKAELPGEYDAPASSAYLYYMNEFKTWNAINKVTINKSNV